MSVGTPPCGIPVNPRVQRNKRGVGGARATLHAEATLERDACPEKGLPQEHPTCMHTLVGCRANMEMPALMRNFSCNNCIRERQPNVLCTSRPVGRYACIHSVETATTSICLWALTQVCWDTLVSLLHAKGTQVLTIRSSESRCPARAMKQLLNRQDW